MKNLVWIFALLAVGLGALAIQAAPVESSIGAYSTPISSRTQGQRHNAKLAMDAIEGTVIPPGGTFSFNGVVGTYSRDAGYRKAPVSYNGQLIDDWGGGVCQTSTTLYNAALVSGLHIVERHSHRFAPSYVPVGRDAAVAYRNIDLVLSNPYPFPVRISGEVGRGQLTVRILSAQRPSALPTVLSQVNDFKPASTIEVGQQSGRRRIRTTGKDGADVSIFRQWPDGRRELISHKSYPAMARVIEYQSPERVN